MVSEGSDTNGKGAAMKRSATAVWAGDLKSGKGRLSGPSGVLSDTPYSFRTRFEEPVTGTNPEELIAAAHAGCFSMALSGELTRAEFQVERIATTATLSLDQVDGKPTITKIHLDVAASIPVITPEKFQELAEGAKKNCPVSRLLNAEITMSAKLA
jgi:lipoyl-dependent peroxiredoxin